MACGPSPEHESNTHIHNIRGILPILGFSNEILSLAKSFACSGLDAPRVLSFNPIPNLESQSSQIGTFFAAEVVATVMQSFMRKSLFVAGGDGLQSVPMRSQFALSEQKSEGQTKESKDRKDPHAEVVAGGIARPRVAVVICPTDEQVEPE